MVVPELDRALGLEVYATDTAGIDGSIRNSVDDFVVEEVLVDGSVARIKKGTDSNALNAKSERQRYLLCILVKRNWDTFVALKKIADQIGVNQMRIQIAGIKDAKAFTGQYITIENVVMEDLQKIQIRDVEVRPVGYFRDALSPFYLLGNRFAITICKVEEMEDVVTEQIRKTMQQLKQGGGIPNFFGHQRFGTTRPITHLVGKAIVNGDFEMAVMLFLAKPSSFEHPESRQARIELETTGDFGRALQSFPKQLRFERLMLRELAKKPNDFVGAFKRLPFKLQMLFVQAYQSYLFNLFLSKRIIRGVPLGTAEIGDFVVSGERSGLPMPKTGKLVTSGSIEEVNEKMKLGKLSVALPLVGFRHNLSQGAMGEIEKQILELENLETSCFRIGEIPRISERGGLRTVLSPVMDYSFEALGQRKVELRFMLLRGSYATMLLREIMKPDDPIAAGF